MSVSQVKILFDIQQTASVKSSAIDIKDKSVADALEEVLQGTGFHYVLIEDVYVIRDTAEQPREEEFIHVVYCTRSSCFFQFTDIERGKFFHYILCWQNARGENGPFSAAAYAVIP
jgi:hypothetical protein